MARLPTVLRWPARWWASQSLRARLTLITTALFAVAVVTGAILVLVLQRYALLKVLDSSAQKTGVDVAKQIRQHPELTTVQPTTGGVTALQVVDRNDAVIAASPGTDRLIPILRRSDLAEARTGDRIDLTDPNTDARQRIVAVRVGSRTVLVATDLSRVDDSLRVLTRVALIGSPIAVLMMGIATYLVCALTLRPVAALRHGAADITAAGLSDQRLPVPSAQDEVHRLAVTLNAMLDRIDASTARQRGFVGDAAHELRSPLASMRVQLEVAQRIGPGEDFDTFAGEVLIDVSRLDRLVEDLLSLARLDEAAGAHRRESVELAGLAQTVTAGYQEPRVPVHLGTTQDALVKGDPDGLRRVIVNLVDNALRHATSDVQVDVRNNGSNGHRGVTIVVTDDGPGIPPAEREKVFDRFYRLEASRSRESGGTGLGLPIVRDLVRAHGGTVRLTSRQDGEAGLVAIVSLPADHA